MPIDTAALLDSTRALLVIFIILICIINLILLVKQVRKARFYQSPKLMTIISLAIGDIMMAMFPLVVIAKLTFELGQSVFECRLIFAVATYYNYLLHFVYGLSLIALGTEVLTRSNLRSLCSPSVAAVVMAGVPWLLGLIIILPLCMANIDYNRCINYETPTAMYTVSVLLPATLAVLLLIIFNCIRLPIDQQQYRQMNAANFQPTIANQQGMAQYPLNQQGMAQYPPNQQDMSQYPHMQQGQLMHNLNHVTDINQTQPENTVDVPDMRRTELQRLLIISIIFFFMVVPNAAISIATGGVVHYDSYSLTVAVQVFQWLMVARSCLTPLIMIFYSDL